MAKVLERSLYQTDYYAWTKQQAAELRRLAAARANTTLDLANLAEEVESLGTSQLSGVKSQMRRVMEHLLKLEHSPAAEPRAGWRRTIIEARDEISDDLTATLRRDAEAALDLLYEQSRRRARTALAEHGDREAAQALPMACPYSFDQIVDQDWYRPTVTASTTTS
jgi:Domain of unknown function DUF29